MIKNIVIFLLGIADYFHQRKIINFIKSKGFNYFKIMFDVGAHRGETIKLFLSNFEIEEIYSFEPSPINFEFLKKKQEKFEQKYRGTKIFLENIALGNKTHKSKINHFTESSSSSLKQFNKDANYYKKKLKVLNISKNINLVDEFEIDVLKSSDFIKNNIITKIDFLKIDTEGYEYEVISGLDNIISNVEIIMFEHHYDNMLNKNYTFSDISTFLKKNNFTMVYKSKMPFRKTYEYIFFNKRVIENGSK